MQQNKSELFFRTVPLCILAIIIYLLYLPGLSGTFYYDDIRPLSGLGNVTDVNSALLYISTESSGPLGRPISMLSFLFNVNDWPTSNNGNINAFFKFNVILHIINGLLIFALSYVIATLCNKEKKYTYWLSLSVAALWLVLPLHAASTLIAIQRMALLSAFFMFSGLLIYTYGLYLQSKNKVGGFKLQLIALFIFTSFAMFSKENGILLPVFVLVIETTLLNNIAAISQYRRLRVNACLCGLAVILMYLLYFAISSNNTLDGRDYTLVERLLTQPQILLDYIRLAFIPNIDAINPFHDNYQYVNVTSISPWSITSIILNVILLCSALYFRKRLPLLSFAVLWFFTAHLLESSVLNLELYYQHRNYIALFGPCLAIALFIANIKTKYQKALFTCAICYWGVLAFSLLLTTQTWGNSLLAAKVWHSEQRGSERASAHLAYKYFNLQKPQLAWQTMEQQSKACPNCINSTAHSMLFSCFVGAQSETYKYFERLKALAPNSTHANSVASTIGKVNKLVRDERCSALQLNDLKELNTYLLNQLPDSPYNKKLPFIQNLYTIALIEKNRTKAIDLLYLAWQEKKDENIAKELVAMLIAAKSYQKAEEFISSEVCQLKHSNPFLRQKSDKLCEQLTDKLLERIIIK